MTTSCPPYKCQGFPPPPPPPPPPPHTHTHSFSRGSVFSAEIVDEQGTAIEATFWREVSSGALLTAAAAAQAVRRSC